MVTIRELESLDPYKAFKIVGEGSSADVFPAQRYARLVWYATGDDSIIGVVLHDHARFLWGWYKMHQIKAGTPGGDALLAVSPGLSGGYAGIDEDRITWCRSIELATAELHNAMLVDK